MPESGFVVTRGGRDRGEGGARSVLFPDSSVLLTSRDAGWAGLSAERLRLTLETPEHEHDAHFLTLQIGAPARVEWREGGRHASGFLTPGAFTLIGAGAPHAVRYDGADVLAVSLAPDLAHRVAADSLGEGAADRLQFVPQNEGTPDPQVERFGLLLKDEMEAGCPSGRLFGDAVGQALAAHLVARYATAGRAPADGGDAGRLSPRRLRRALDFLEENLTRDVSLAEVAAEVGLSPYHFARQFKASLGVPPHAYLISRRVERAKELLARTDLPLAQVALAAGFAHQSHLTRHFRRLVGTTPARFR